MKQQSEQIVKAIITTLDNLENNKEQLAILLDDPFVSEIIFVDQDSKDGAGEWMDEVTRQYSSVKVIHRENNGAGPGRNAGLDAAGKFDYVLMLDGGIRPLRGGVDRMLEYLDDHPGVDVIGVEIADFETDREKAWRRWVEPIRAYRNMRLSHTAYCLCRARAWNGQRFSEEGPFAEEGWGVDDDDMAYRWNEAGIVIHVATGVHPYRHASGSFRRIVKDTGIWANQYGSAYEARLVKLCQDWPQYEPGGAGLGAQWGEPWLTVVVRNNSVEGVTQIIKRAHYLLRLRRFDPPWHQVVNPYSIILWCPPGTPEEMMAWAEPRRWRQHHGDTVIVNGEIVKRNENNEATWTGDFRIWRGKDWKKAIRPNAFYYSLIEDIGQLEKLIAQYNEIHPSQPVKNPPREQEWLIIM